MVWIVIALLAIAPTTSLLLWSGRLERAADHSFPLSRFNDDAVMRAAPETQEAPATPRRVYTLP